MSLLSYLAQATRAGTPSHRVNLTVIPLFGPSVPKPDYLTLAQALEKKLLSITETSESGSVPVLRARNQGSQPVLLIDGEELVGAKQNRVINLTVLLPPHRLTDIPVSCVEQGRWAYRSRNFNASDSTLFPRARSRQVAQVSASIRGGARAANQSDLWADISKKASRLGTVSDTDSMNGIYGNQEKHLRDYLGAFAPEPGQTGAAFGIDGRVLGIELFDSPATFAEYFPKLIRSWGLDALEAGSGGRGEAEPLQAWQASVALMRLGESPVESFAAVGLGEDLRFGTARAPGAALAYEGRVVHLVKFMTHPA